jgi:PelA/Pel-15E family pectate lyase
MKTCIALLLVITFFGCTPRVPSAPAALAPEETTPQTAITWNKAQNQKPAWYSTPEAARIADNLLLYQKSNGGWDKNIDMAHELTPAEIEKLTSPFEKSGVSTIDNRSTFTQLKYLAKAFQGTQQQKYKESFLRGMDYLLKAQYPTGGWPQFYPLREGYYSYITFNDGAMIGVMALLREIAQGREPYTFVDAVRKQAAAQAIDKGLEVILKTQITVNGQLTAWCAQHHPVTFLPQKARAYELVSLSGMESVGIVEYLLQLENPSPAVQAAITKAVAWLQSAKLTGLRLDKIPNESYTKGYDLVVVKDVTAPPLLARFYAIDSNTPMFVGRDGKVHQNLSEIAQERRTGYNWYAAFPEDLVGPAFLAWKQKWAAQK